MNCFFVEQPFIFWKVSIITDKATKVAHCVPFSGDACCYHYEEVLKLVMMCLIMLKLLLYFAVFLSLKKTEINFVNKQYTNIY